MKTVSWYPGHINKAIREMELQVKKIDILIILLDARAPFSTYIDLFEKLTQNKKVLIVLTKKDLSTDKEVNQVINFYRKKHPTVALNLKQNKQKELDKVFKELRKIQTKSLIPKIMILGVPNVGKSTIINFLSKKNKAVAQDRAGVTRGTTWFKVENFYLMDTPGVLLPKFEDKNVNYKLALIGSIKQSILPYDDVGKYLLDYLVSEGKITLQENETIEEYATNQASKRFQTLDVFYLNLLKQFQTAKFGKNYLDNFSWNFEEMMEEKSE